MPNVTVGLHREFIVRGDDALDDTADELMKALLDLVSAGCIIDPAVGIDKGTGRVEIEVAASGSDYDKALAEADSSIRSAIHTVGGATAGWIVATLTRSELVDTDENRATVDALLTAGVLNAPYEQGSDTSVVVAWRFVPPATSCGQQTTTITTASTSASTTTSATTSTATTETPATTGPATTGPVTTEPSTTTGGSRSSTSSTSAPVTTTSAAPSGTKPGTGRTTPGARPSLAETGLDVPASALLSLGAGCIIIGLGVLLGGRRRDADHR